MAEVPIGERAAKLEAENEVCERDRRDLWDAMNAVRSMAAELGSVRVTLAQVKELCEVKDARIQRADARIAALESKEAERNGARNLLLGGVALVGSSVGSLVTWALTHFLAGGPRP
jgi:predicted component of type VI protein secretion system